MVVKKYVDKVDMDRTVDNESCTRELVLKITWSFPGVLFAANTLPLTWGSSSGAAGFRLTVSVSNGPSTCVYQTVTSGVDGYIGGTISAKLCQVDVSLGRVSAWLFCHEWLNR